MRTAVGIVLKTLNGGRNAILGAFEIDQPIVVTMTTAHVAGGDTTVVVTAAGLGLFF